MRNAFSLLKKTHTHTQTHIKIKLMMTFGMYFRKEKCESVQARERCEEMRMRIIKKMIFEKSNC